MMINEMQEFVTERGEALVGQVRKLRETSSESVREAIVGGAGNIKALKSPVRVITRSTIKLTAVSQETVQSLIELQSEIVTSALTEAALRLERMSRAENIIELVREQIELTPATRDRLVDEATRALTILKGAGRDFRSVAKHAYESIADKAEKDEAPKKVVRRKPAAKRARKTVAKTAAAA